MYVVHMVGGQGYRDRSTGFESLWDAFSYIETDISTSRTVEAGPPEEWTLWSGTGGWGIPDGARVLLFEEETDQRQLCIAEIDRDTADDWVSLTMPTPTSA